MKSMENATLQIVWTWQPWWKTKVRSYKRSKLNFRYFSLGIRSSNCKYFVNFYIGVVVKCPFSCAIEVTVMWLSNPYCLFQLRKKNRYNYLMTWHIRQGDFTPMEFLSKAHFLSSRLFIISLSCPLFPPLMTNDRRMI